VLINWTGTQGLIFVIDSSDKVRIDEARQELHRIINDREMKESLLLVFANKQDIAGGMFTPSHLARYLRHHMQVIYANKSNSNVTPRSNRCSKAQPTER